MLPIIIFLENHHHLQAKLALTQVLDIAKQKGYKDIAIEAPLSFSQKEIIDASTHDLEQSLESLKQILPYSLNVGVTEEKMYSMKFSELSEFFHKYVSSKKYAELASVIHGTPARREQKKLLSFAIKNKFNLTAVDDENSPLYKVSLIDSGLHGRAEETRRSEEVRDKIIASNTVTLYKEKGNAILQVGALHFSGIFDFLKENELLENTIFVYPESKSCFGDTVDLSLPKSTAQKCPNLVTMPVDNQEQLAKFINAFQVKLNSMVTPTYDGVVTTTLVEKLKQLNQNYTGGYIKTFHQVDGILPLSPELNVDSEIEKLKSLKITPTFVNATLLNKKCDVLCIRDINGSSNAEKVNKIIPY